MVAAGQVRALVVCVVGTCGCLGCGRVFALRACHICVQCAPVGRVVMLRSVCFGECVRCVLGWSDAAAWAWCDVLWN